MENGKKSYSTYFLIGLIIVQFGVIGYLIVSNNNKKTEIEELTTTVDVKDAEIVARINSLDSLTVEYDRIRLEREALGLSNDSLNMQLDELKKFKERALAAGKISARDKRLMENMIAKMRQDLIVKDQEIAQLKSDKQLLEGQVADLNSEKSKLGDSLSGVSSAKKDLENQLSYASILKAQNFVITALKENGKEFTEEEYKSKKISQMKISFTLSDNKAAKHGNRDFFVSIVPPSGETFSDPMNGGGNLTTAEGETKAYTFKQSAVFTNSNEKITFLIPKGFNYVAGQYGVHVYADGYDIGHGKFSVR
jgi:chromosome segregation ATPase